MKESETTKLLLQVYPTDQNTFLFRHPEQFVQVIITIGTGTSCKESMTLI